MQRREFSKVVFALTPVALAVTACGGGTDVDNARSGGAPDTRPSAAPISNPGPVITSTGPTAPADDVGLDESPQPIILRANIQKGLLLGIQSNGQLLRYADTKRTGLGVWESPTGEIVGEGWGQTQLLCGGHNGTFYARSANGNLWLYDNASTLLPTLATPQSSTPILLSSTTQWASFRVMMFSNVANNGKRILYGIDTAGDLYWIMHGITATHQHSVTALKLGSGYQDVAHLFPRYSGTFFAVTNAGGLRLYVDSASLGRSHLTPITPQIDGSSFSLISASGWLAPTGAQFSRIQAAGDGRVYCQAGNKLYLKTSNSNIHFTTPLVLVSTLSNLMFGTNWITAAPRTFYGYNGFYPKKITLSPGDNLELSISSMSPTATLAISRATHNPNPAVSTLPVNARTSTWNLRPVTIRNLTNLVSQDFPSNARVEGCKWPVSYSMPIGREWPSGLYSMKLDAGAYGYVWSAFVVRPLPTAVADFAVIANTNTWNAYEYSWDGSGIYSTPGLHRVSTHTPSTVQIPHYYGRGVHLLGQETVLLSWMAKNNYNYHVYADQDVDDGTLDMHKYKCVVLHAHPEYWTVAAYQKLQNYIAQGGRVISIGGNGPAYWPVEYTDNQTIMQRHNYGKPNFSVQEMSLVDTPPWQVLGTFYTGSGYNTYASYKVLNAQHPIFMGTGLSNGQDFGFDATGGVASGHETDKATPFTNLPAGLQILARGNNPNNGGSELTYYSTPSGGWVISGGSLTFTVPLIDSFDPKHEQIVRNMLNMGKA